MPNPSGLRRRLWPNDINLIIETMDEKSSCNELKNDRRCVNTLSGILNLKSFCNILAFIFDFSNI